MMNGYIIKCDQLPVGYCADEFILEIDDCVRDAFITL